MGRPALAGARHDRVRGVGIGPAAPRFGGWGLALRWADHPLCQRVLAALGEPIISTSVNAKDEAPRTTAAAIAAFPGDVALVVDAPVGVARASALVDGRTEPPRVLRAGAVRVEWDEPKPS